MVSGADGWQAELPRDQIGIFWVFNDPLLKAETPFPEELDRLFGHD